MRTIVVVILGFLFASPSTFAQDTAAKHAGEGARRASGTAMLDKAVVPTAIEAHPSLGKLPEPVLTDVLTRLDQAIYLSANILPEGNSLFEWGEDKTALPKKNVRIRLTTSQDPMFKMMAANMTTDTDAMTLVTKSKSTDEMTATVFLAVDRLALTPEGKERTREQIAARMNTALAHELHGNVLSYLQLKSRDPNFSPEFRAKMEVRAFKAGITFLESLMANPGFADLPAHEKAAYQERLKNEKAMLADWERKLK